MKVSKWFACTALMFLAVNGVGFASQDFTNAEVERVLSVQQKIIFANDCADEDKINGQCPSK
jgi:hypothetical protein